MLGVSGGMPGNADSLHLSAAQDAPRLHLVHHGHRQGPSALHAAGPGRGCDGLRVGLEDNIFLEKGVLATNAQLVEQACKLGELAGRTIATAADAREVLGLTKHI